MDTASTELFGKFPRRVGEPRQWFVHSSSEFDSFVEANQGRKNLYSTISYYGRGGTPITDKVSIDLDSPGKEAAFPDAEHEFEKIQSMRDDPDLAQYVLGDVVEDARAVSQWAEEQEVPFMAVFTGFGIHVHLLFEPEPRPEEKLTSVVEMLREELNLETVDRVVEGDVERLMKVPNCERVDSGRGCNLYSIPLSRGEVQEANAPALLEESRTTRSVSAPLDDRPAMPHYPEYVTSDNGQETVEQQEPLELAEDRTSENFREFVREAIKMPCMAERLFQADPPHQVRQNSAVLLFNLGMSVDDVQNVFSRMNWRNYDPEITRKQLEQIHSRGYGDMSCETVQSAGLCLYSPEERENCPTFGWQGGKCYYE